MGVYKKNVFLIKIYHSLIKRVTMPIIVLYYLLHSLSYTQIGILASALAISVITFEIPSGIFADKYGRKNSLLICSLLGFASMILFLVGSGFWVFLIAVCLFGFSMAFFSGAEEALLFDSLLVEKREKEYRKELGEVHFFSNVVSAVVLAVIPFIYSINVRYPFIIGVLFYLASFFVARNFKEAPLKTKESKQLHYIPELIKSKGLFLLILFGASGMASIFATSEYYQPLLKIVGLSIPLFGLVYFAKRILTGIGAKIAYKFEKKIKIFNVLLISVSLILLSYLLIYLGKSSLIILGILLYSLTEGIFKVSIKDDINKISSSHNRATILSIMGFLQELIIAILALIYGYFADIFGIQIMFGLGLMIVMVILISLLILVKILDNLK